MTQAETPVSSLLLRRVRALVLLAIGGLCATGPLMGQGFPRARPGEFEVRGFDIALDGGWRRATGQIRVARQAALRAGAYSRLDAPGLTVRGTFHLPVIPLAFADVPLPFSPAAYQALFFDAIPTSRPYSVRSFYRGMSRGHVTLEGRVFDPVPVPQASGYYEDGCNGVGIYGPCPVRARSRMGDLLLTALDAVSQGAGADTVWNRFDNDGPDGVPNSGDDDGIVDLVTFLQPRVDGACGATAIWAHRYVIRGWNDGAMYTTRTPRRNAAGQSIPGQFLRVDSYTLQSARGGASSCAPNEMMPIGTVAHETGHAFGLPDLYDTDRVTPTEGVGEWSLMGAGNYATPESPSSLDAWSLVQLGWVTVDTLATGREVVTGPVQVSDTVFHVPTATAGVYYLLENRQPLLNDAAMMSPFFARPKGPGLLIWRIDDARVASGLPANTVNSGLRPGVALVQADGHEHLRAVLGAVRNRGDAGDPWPGTSSRSTFGLMTLPSAANWDGVPLGVRIDRLFSLSGGRVGLRVTRGPASLVTVMGPAGKVTIDGFSGSRWSEVLAVGDTVRITVDSVQYGNAGRTLAAFVRWQDGSPRDRTHVATNRPDTLVAEFRVVHELRVARTAGGVVTSSVAGTTGAGAPVAHGLGARLHATADSGSVFVRWSGDTVAATRQLDLVMYRPWSVTAEFIAPVAIRADAAAIALLGGAPLDATAAAYLDTTGNRNGAYDLGDLLAWLRRTGQAIPATLLDPSMRNHRR